MDVLNSMIEAFENPATRHAMIVHLPMALAVVGVPFVIAAVLFSRSLGLRMAVLAMYILCLGGAWMGRMSGEEAEAQVPGDLTPAAIEALERHEFLGMWFWITVAVTVSMLAMSLIPKPPVRRLFGVLAVLASLVTLGWAALLGHEGGQLVYTHGVGTPVMLSADTPTPAPVGRGDDVSPDDDDDVDGDRDLGDDTADRALPPEPIIFTVANFEQYIEPILSSNCFRCHNERNAPRRGGLDLTSKETMLRGGNSGAIAVVPGDVEMSLLVKSILYDNEDLQMPPNGRLSDHDIELLTEWVRQGALRPAPDGDAGAGHGDGDAGDDGNGGNGGNDS